MFCLPLNIDTLTTVKMDLLFILIPPCRNFKESDYSWAFFSLTIYNYQRAGLLEKSIEVFLLGLIKSMKHIKQ